MEGGYVADIEPWNEAPKMYPGLVVRGPWAPGWVGLG